MDDELGPWAPLTPAELSTVMAELSAPWWLAGGWALDAFLGKKTRQHEDLDVLVLRRDHAEVRRVLADWDVHAADPPGSLRPWPVGEVLPGQVHDVWVRSSTGAPWSFQLVIDDEAGDDWVYQRDARITRPLAKLALADTVYRCHVLAPEVQLLYKSKGLRAKDQQDFEAVAPALDVGRRRWLREALELVSPEHPWLASRQRAGSGVARVLVTGMSGAGKSTLLGELRRRGHLVVDTEYDGWTLPSGLWDEVRMTRLLAEHGDVVVSGTTWCCCPLPWTFSSGESPPGARTRTDPPSSSAPRSPATSRPSSRC